MVDLNWLRDLADDVETGGKLKGDFSFRELLLDPMKRIGEELIANVQPRPTDGASYGEDAQESEAPVYATMYETARWKESYTFL